MEQIHNTYRRLRDKIFTFLYRFSFKELASKSTLSMPFCVEGAKYIAIKKDVFIKSNAWLLALNQFDLTSEDTKLSIDEGTYIGRNIHIVSLKSIRIGKNVLIADNVYIADNYHRFNRVDLPFKDQGVGFKAKVEIGDGTWLGENVCVISCKIGKQCVVGANSLVINDVPDYSMVAGIPAKIIKVYNHTTKSWERTQGNKCK